MSIMSVTQTQPFGTAADEAALRDLFERLLTTWARGDADAYGKLFTEDADYIAFDGASQKGREAIVQAHRPLFERFLKGSRLTGEVIGLRFLEPGVALLHASGGTVLAGKTAPEAARASIQTFVALKRDDGWRFTSFHNTRVRPIGGLGSVLLWNLTDGLWRLFRPRTPSPTA